MPIFNPLTIVQDHFALILNQPAGELAQIVVEYTVNLVVKAWDNPGMTANRLQSRLSSAYSTQTSTMDIVSDPSYANG